MSGITFLVNERGAKTAAVINLRQHGRLWEDFYDTLVARSRRTEPRETLAEVRAQLGTDAHTFANRPRCGLSKQPGRV